MVGPAEIVRAVAAFLQRHSDRAVFQAQGGISRSTSLDKRICLRLRTGTLFGSSIPYGVDRSSLQRVEVIG